MKTTATAATTARKPLRVWPGVIAAAAIVLLWFILPPILPGAAAYSILGGAAGAMVILIWWLFFSRARWAERLGAVALMAAAVAATKLVVHPSVAGGFQGMMVPIAVPSTLGPAFVAWAVAARRTTGFSRWVTMAIAILAGCAVWTALRTDGVKGEAGVQLRWRWTPTAEERLLARAPEEPLPSAPADEPHAAEPVAPAPVPAAGAPAPAKAADAPAPATAAPDTAAPAGDPAAKTGKTMAAASAAWPGFRGTDRDGVIRRLRIATDWATSPPVELWRRPVGPGWSSFAVDGGLIYTQEQRGEHEVVSCYRLGTGELVWRHQDAVRFYESNGGPGPRGTPAVHGGRVYTLGATGIVNALDARTGRRIWSRSAEADTGAPRPGWGFAASPIVVDDLLIVAASGRLAGYERETGELRWTRTTGGGGYSSPHLATLDGVPQVLLLNGGGVTSVSPTDGAVLWENRTPDGISIVQPKVLGGRDILVAAGDAMGGLGIRRLAVSRRADGWAAEERWTTRGLKPYFSDYVVHENHAYGFDGTILSCIDLETGERRWKGGRYGAGQMMLLAEQDLLLVVSEDGDLVLVSATPEKHTEITRASAIEGKTWNHPAIVGDILLVRNGEEMAAFRLSRAVR